MSTISPEALERLRNISNQVGLAAVGAASQFISMADLRALLDAYDAARAQVDAAERARVVAHVKAPVFWVGARWSLGDVVDYLLLHLGGDEHAALLMLLAHMDGEPARLAAAREEVRAALLRALEHAKGLANYEYMRAHVFKASHLDATPLADELRALRAAVDEERLKRQEWQLTAPALEARAEKAEADQHCPTCGSSVYTCVDCDVTPLRVRVAELEQRQVGHVLVSFAAHQQGKAEVRELVEVLRDLVAADPEADLMNYADADERARAILEKWRSVTL